MSNFEQSCKFCGDKFTSLRGLNIHMNVHRDRPEAVAPTPTPPAPVVVPRVTNNQDPSLSCRFCPLVFPWRHKLYQHLREAHPDAIFGPSQKPGVPTTTPQAQPQVVAPPVNVKCKICETEMPQAKLNDHMKEHLEKPPKIRACPNCDKKFMSKSELSIHRQQSHGEKKKKVRKCEKCPKTFDSKQLLAEHVQRRHEETQCPRCCAKFPSRRDAKSHFNVAHKRQKKSTTEKSPVKVENSKTEPAKEPEPVKELDKQRPAPPVLPFQPPKVERKTPSPPNVAKELPVAEPETADIKSDDQPKADELVDVIVYQDTRIFFKDEEDKVTIEKIIKGDRQPNVSLYRLPSIRPGKSQAGSRIKLITEKNNNDSNNTSTAQETPSKKRAALVNVELVLPKKEPGITDINFEEQSQSPSLSTAPAAATTPPPTATCSGKRRSDSNISSDSKRSKTNSGGQPTATTATADINDTDAIHRFSDNEPQPLFIPNLYDLNLEAPMSQDFPEADDVGDLNQSILNTPSAEAEKTDQVRSTDINGFRTPTIRLAKNLQSQFIDPTNISITEDVQPPQASTSHQFFNELCQPPSGRPPTPILRPANDSSCSNEPSSKQQTDPQIPSDVQPPEDSKPASLARLSTSNSRVSESTPNRCSKSDSTSSSQTTSSASSRRLNFKFQTLANKLISRIGRLQILIEKNATAGDIANDQIYENFDEVSGLWEKIDSFVEGLSESENSDFIMEESQKLLSRVNQLSQYVMALQKESPSFLKTIKEAPKSDEPESVPESSSQMSNVKAEASAV